MKHLATWLLAMALLLAGGVPFSAAQQIQLKQAGGTITPLGGVGDAAKVVNGSEDTPNGIMRIESQWDYETVAASQTDQVAGTTGAAGDLLHAVHCVFTAAPGAAVQIQDGTGSEINLIAITSGADTKSVMLDIPSLDGGWKLTTGTNTTCIMIGRFS